MSQFYDTAEAIAAHLATITALADVPVVVNRQKELESELRKALGKQAGCLAVISWAGSPNEDLSADGPLFKSSYTVHLFSRPILRSGQTPADDLMEAMATALHDHRLTAGGAYRDRLVVTGIEPEPHDELLIYVLTLTTPSQL